MNAASSFPLLPRFPPIRTPNARNFAANATRRQQFKRVMVKNFSVRDINSPRSLSTLVRATSKLSIEELTRVTGSSAEDANAIIKVCVCWGRGRGRGWGGVGWA